MKQDIQKAYAEKNKTVIMLLTELMAAEYDQNVTLNLAKGDAQSIIINAQANSVAYKIVQNNMTQLYSQLIANTSMTNLGFLNYLKAKLVKNFDSPNKVVSLSKIDDL